MTGTIAKYEFLFTIKRPGYLILTFGLPVILGMYAGFISLISVATAGAMASGLSAQIGVVDKTGLIETAERAAVEQKEQKEAAEQTAKQSGRSNKIPQLDALEAMVREVIPDAQRYDTLKAGRVALEAGEIDGLVLVPEDYLQNRTLDYYTRTWQMFKGLSAPQQVRRQLYVGVLERAELTAEERAMIESRGKGEGLTETAYYELGPDGKFLKVDTLSRTVSFVLPAAVAGILIVALLINAGFLLAGVAEEKENKVFEVLFSMVRVDHLLMGKVLGLSAAALLQLVIWGAMILPLPFLTFLVIDQVVDFEWHATSLLLAALFFILGFLFYGSLFVGIGALGNNVKESQQYSTIIALLPVIPMVAFMSLLNSPNGIVARALAWFPPTSAPAMMLRLATREVPLWDAAVAALLLIVGIWISVKIAARMLLVGGMMRGQSLNPLKMLRLLLNR